MSSASKTGDRHPHPETSPRRWALLSALLWAVAPASASATLGGRASTVQEDQAQMQGSARQSAAASYTVHEIQAPSGIVVREYVSPSGTVFGVAWQGPFRPDLRQLLGTYFDQLQEAAAAQSRRGGRRPVRVERPGLVVHMGGHQRAFFGRAYVPGLLPQGLSTDEIQ